ncbi:hypothetical protein L7F22_059221 [Adiantum nelumboides]|nr:hypothetical protein [Adiantum nelumboides]
MKYLRLHEVLETLMIYAVEEWNLGLSDEVLETLTICADDEWHLKQIVLSSIQGMRQQEGAVKMVERVAHWRQLLGTSLQANGHLKHSSYFQLATVRRDGRPANRTIVFRNFMEESNLLQFTTDSRSDKIEEIFHNPRGEVSSTLFKVSFSLVNFNSYFCKATRMQIQSVQVIEFDMDVGVSLSIN